MDAARVKAAKRKTKLRVETGDTYLPVLRLWKSGFAVDCEDAPKLRGFVDLYDGSKHLYQALIVTSAEASGERRYEFKRATAVLDRPPADFEAETPPPAGLLGKTKLL